MTITRKTVAGLAAILVGAAVAGGAAAQQERMGRERGMGPPDRAAEAQTRWAQRFAELYDTDGDGQVSLEEIVADQGRLFGAIDVDADDRLSVEEVKRRGTLLKMWRVTTLFDLMDADGDGQLTKDEISAPTARWFKRYDADGDGIMAADELPERRWRGRQAKRYR